ncbi:hypothetical protein B0I37DRAFT_383257 [Chaetomium sp. MPI-CAGE-AT-0009]|nr:hypothetical protein B0I37DRAFT_383257 [Chaetomium sp. MPI-CAGE-AT-0009]
MSAITPLQTRDLLDDDRRDELRATTVILLVLATVFVGLRFWARSCTYGRYGRDDYITVASLIAVFALGAVNLSEISYGLGRHIGVLPQQDVIAFFKLLLAHECIYITAVLLVKLSVLLMYLRIFGNASRKFKVTAMILAGTNVAWWVSIFVVCIFQCNPIRKAWLPWIEGECIDLKASFIGNGIPNILTDVVMLSLPIGEVWKMRLPLGQKLSVCSMFLLGTFVIVSSVYRFTTLMLFDTSDTTWTLATACTWCVVEVACGVISACLPTLRPLMLKISQQFLRRDETAAGDGNNQASATFGSAEDEELREQRKLQRLNKPGGFWSLSTALGSSTLASTSG